jgi:ribosomal protein S19
MPIPNEEECHIRLPSVDPKNNFAFFRGSKFCQILIQKNMISTCTKDFSWKRNWPKFSRFQKKKKIQIA